MLERNPQQKKIGGGRLRVYRDEDLTFPNSSSKESVALQELLQSCQSCQNCISERKQEWK